MTNAHHPIRTAVAVVVASGVAALASIWAFVGPASGTAAPSASTDVLPARGTVADGFKIQVDGIRVSAKGPIDIATAHLTFPPGATTGWHIHPGPVLVIVEAGTVTKYSSNCVAHRYTTGQAFVERGPRDVNMVRNEGTTQADTIVTFLAPVGAQLKENVPAPCNP
jgi:quercetin dioxygenase-like cupin family protein